MGPSPTGLSQRRLRVCQMASAGTWAQVSSQSSDNGSQGSLDPHPCKIHTIKPSYTTLLDLMVRATIGFGYKWICSEP